MIISFRNCKKLVRELLSQDLFQLKNYSVSYSRYWIPRHCIREHGSNADNMSGSFAISSSLAKHALCLHCKIANGINIDVFSRNVHWAHDTCQVCMFPASCLPLRPSLGASQHGLGTIRRMLVSSYAVSVGYSYLQPGSLSARGMLKAEKNKYQRKFIRTMGKEYETDVTDACAHTHTYAHACMYSCTYIHARIHTHCVYMHTNIRQRLCGC
jgi:hypothetical protein